ncbi:hypothetical protein ACHAP5_005084 [Fusarium lateritium]
MSTDYSFTREAMETAVILEEDRRQILDQAIRNVLGTEVALFTYAQILDGLPTEQSLSDSTGVYTGCEDHPVLTLQHKEICPGFVEKALDFRAQFDISVLEFELKALEKFQKADHDSEEFKLRLIELTVVACHQIGAHLFELDDGAHKHELYTNWRETALEERNNGVETRKFASISPTAFSHRVYRYFEQYPKGLADVAGYWAESKIFGGVIVFDRGESEEECKSMWIHGDLAEGPVTLYPPTEEQFNSLVNFLTSKDEDKLPYPFPIHGKRFNRPRWHHWHAFKHHHIFRNRYERRVSSELPRPHCVSNWDDWPEEHDRTVLLLVSAGITLKNGKPVYTEEDYQKAEVDIRKLTPSSPLWKSFGPNPEPLERLF